MKLLSKWNLSIPVFLLHYFSTHQSYFLKLFFYVGSVSGILLLPYGGEAGDKNVTDGDDGSVTLPTNSIKIGDKFYNRFIVSIIVYIRLMDLGKHVLLYLCY